MKVRHRLTKTILEASDDQRLCRRVDLDEGEQRWIPSDRLEPVAQDRWQDVTGECEPFTESEFMDCHIFHKGNPISKDSYRLRKVQVGNGAWAFLVERKVD